MLQIITRTGRLDLARRSGRRCGELRLRRQPRGLFCRNCKLAYEEATNPAARMAALCPDQLFSPRLNPWPLAEALAAGGDLTRPSVGRWWLTTFA